MFRCDTCKKEYKYKKNLSRHMMEKHRPDYEHWNCSMCKRKFIKREYLYRHLQKIHGLDKVKSIRMAMESTRGDKNQQPSYYEDISEDDTIFDLIDELDFSDTSQTFDVDKIIPDENNNESQDDSMGQQLEVSDRQSSNEEPPAEHMETDVNGQDDNIEAVSVISVSDDEFSEDTTVGRSGTHVQTIIISMRENNSLCEWRGNRQHI
ncbi:unnamed protein product [Mytilus coruscus]|uniref:C2H2-type domain-containing protein n=1 Tax=Mytilus coruscus TaxID=42192 RepID=A0A6J8C465_MYTCO|nr:unnamed protein product [Mytilus coruscus]